jgi:hypothetical protein
LSSAGSKSPPIATMVMPLAPLKIVKNADAKMHTTPSPPGAKPSSARATRTSLCGVFASLIR